MKTLVISWATYREIIRRPLFWMIATAAAIAIYPVSFFLPYNTFGEDTKMVMDLGLAIIMVAGLAVAIFSASVSIAEEIEGKTAITLLCKPIGRRDFIVGKFLGIMIGVGLLFVILSFVYLTTLYFKQGFEIRERGLMEFPTFAQRLPLLLRIIPGIILTYFQVTTLCAISVALSTRLPIHLNVTACIAVLLLGHLSLQLVQAAQTDAQFRGVEFVARVFATVLPCLEFYNVGPAISTEVPISAEYMLWAFLYCLLYSGVAVFAALLMFEDRDLA